MLFPQTDICEAFGHWQNTDTMWYQHHNAISSQIFLEVLEFLHRHTKKQKKKQLKKQSF